MHIDLKRAVVQTGAKHKNIFQFALLVFHVYIGTGIAITKVNVLCISSLITRLNHRITYTLPTTVPVGFHSNNLPFFVYRATSYQSYGTSS